nr:hypothetical protein [Pandoravirus massiliensis]
MASCRASDSPFVEEEMEALACCASLWTRQKPTRINFGWFVFCWLQRAPMPFSKLFALQEKKKKRRRKEARSRFFPFAYRPTPWNGRQKAKRERVTFLKKNLLAQDICHQSRPSGSISVRSKTGRTHRTMSGAVSPAR